ncbi:MAG TPA: hypothetical protein DCX06_00675 [Opitutae bacterium]|nr:hypothetical protein [Opitutae bacterium]
MKSARLVVFLCALALIGAGMGYVLSHWLNQPQDTNLSASAMPERSLERSSIAPRSDESLGLVQGRLTPSIQFPKNAVNGELVMQFESREDYDAYLTALASKGLKPLGTMDRLLALRIQSDMAYRLNPNDYSAQLDFSYEIRQPLPTTEIPPEALASLKGFGATAKQIVGGLVEGDGSGVLVAVLDSGLQEHSQFNEVSIDRIDSVGAGIDGEGSEHGTSVASIILGSEGIAPNTDLLAIRVLDAKGIGNSYLVADGIVQATDMGAQIINLSLAAYNDSSLLRQAVSYAHSQGVLLVAAAGNDGYNQIAYPAAYENVIAVTAVDASGRQAIFPNQSTKIDIAAPGVSILTANEERGLVSFTGTSAAAPFVTGTLASLLSSDVSMTATQAVDTIKSYLNEAGSAGEDAAYGDGVIDWNRIRERDTSGVMDLALADIHLDPSALPGTTMPIEVTVQNRGTQWTAVSTLEVVINGGEPVTFTVASLGPGLITTRNVYTQVPAEGSEERFTISARVIPENLNDDVRLENNSKGAYYQAK